MKRFAERFAGLALVALLLVPCTAGLAVSLVQADDDHGGRHSGRHWKIGSQGLGAKDHGNETSGEIAAWLFATANLTVALSLLTRVAISVSPAEPLKAGLKRFNRRQKKLLMPLHYALNPAAVLTALLHFSLSSCRSTGLPDWTLIGLLTLVALGLMVKFKWGPRALQPKFYAFHTHPLGITTAFLLLFIGHQMMD